MQRRNFFKRTSLALLGTSLFSHSISQNKETLKDDWKGKKAKNIIFMVSDGMSTGTLNANRNFDKSSILNIPTIGF